MRYLMKQIYLLSCLSLLGENGFCADGGHVSRETASAMADGYLRRGDLDGFRRFMSAMESTGFGRRSSGAYSSGYEEPRYRGEASASSDSFDRGDLEPDLKMALAPILPRDQITLGISDMLDGAPGKDLNKVVEVNLSPSIGGYSRSDISPISSDDIGTISDFFRDKSLPNLVAISVDGRTNVNEILKEIFKHGGARKTLYSLSQISARNPELKESEELSKDTIETIFDHFQSYDHLVREGQQSGVYRTKSGTKSSIVEEVVAPLNIYMTTSGMGSYLPWFSGNYRDGKRVSDRKIMCHYRMREPDTPAPFYLKIEVDVAR